ncbi:hypothetical protein [Legionella shakespearei]|uniref:Uncharacterized protein n=1 Tax=Legionella shakespearei DSM 23087 TaxID=1122169 RepID=A0A0W0Z7A5_9GAMM|nr:hypothetical protein [Legionella shakespearei]KTD65004.1 hypothetical protein Lsha_0373 [Legionella shakespearei DSM 23087]
MKDSEGNIIEITLFESYLAKYLIEHPEFFTPVYEKILKGLEAIHELNKSDRNYDRIMYSLHTVMKDEYKEFKGLQFLKDSPDLFKINYFLKLYCDYFLKADKIKHVPEAPKSHIPTLTELCLYSLFKSQSGRKSLASHLRPKELFHENNRGAKSTESDNLQTTRKLGITTIENTPQDLNAYFPESYSPAQFEYKPDRNSNVGRWMTQRNFPIISGSSGSACDYLSYLITAIPLEPREIKLLFVSVAATLIAKGHHSYFEVMILLDRFGFKLHDAEDFYSFYEQMLPKEIVSSESYQEFKHSAVGARLLEGIHFEPEENRPSRMLPELFIATS